MFDTETGGLDEGVAPITQYAAIVLDGKSLKEIGRYETYVQPYGDLVIDPEVLEKTGVTASDINRGLKLPDFVKTLTEFWLQYNTNSSNRELGRLIPVGHNVPFDIAFVSAALHLAKSKGFYYYHYKNFIDTFPLAKMTWGIKGDEKLNLGACCERARVKLTDAHGAMNDVEATADLFRWYTKKMRAVIGEKSGGGEEEGGRSTRARGQEFFEFKCGVK